MKSKLPKLFLGGVVLYLITSALSYVFFNYFSGSSSTGGLSALSLPKVGKSGFKIDTSAPKTEICPLNGAKFTKEEKKIWEERRPLTVMIENHEESRPQSGLSYADVVYEATVEGGITRFMAVFYCSASAEDVIIGPVRSTRVYYLDFASEYGDFPLYVHAGGANDFQNSGDTHPKAKALEKITSLGWNVYNDIPDVGFPTFVRYPERYGREVAWEHTLFSFSEKLWALAQKRGLGAVNDKEIVWNKNFISWKFKEDVPLEKRGDIKEIGIEFFGAYDNNKALWRYNKEDNTYLRFTGGQEHKDMDNDQSLKTKVVVVQYMKEDGPVDRNKHLLYQTTGTGKTLVFQDGNVIEGAWKKKDMKSRTQFFDAKSKEIEFNGGPIWIEVTSPTRPVNY